MTFAYCGTLDSAIAVLSQRIVMFGDGELDNRALKPILQRLDRIAELVSEMIKVNETKAA